MATKKELIANLDWVTEKISSQVWTLNLGTLATTWSLLIASKPSDSVHLSIRSATWIFVPCLLSLICEMGQYLSGYCLERHLLSEMEDTDRNDFQYPKDSFLYKMRQRLFVSKIVLTVFAAAILVSILLCELV
jgi:hypothetical protein